MAPRPLFTTRWPLLAVASVAAGLFLSGEGRAGEDAAFVSQVDGSIRAVHGDRLSPAGSNGKTSVAEPGGVLHPDRNTASIRQVGQDNSSRIQQNGTGNFASVDILSSNGNRTTQSQFGSRNVSRIAIVDGGGNSVSIEQRGNDNHGELNLEDSDGIDVRLCQQGDGLDYRSTGISLSSSGTDGRPILIEQAGR